MSPREAMSSPLQTWHLAVGLVVAILSAGVSFGAAQANLSQTRRDIESLQRKVDEKDATLRRIDRNLVRLGERVGVNLETE